jgi:Tol biopolymer transport system component
VYSPLWSPDGLQIAYTGQRKNPVHGGQTLRSIKIFDTRTKITFDILETANIFRPLGWDADSRSIIVAETAKLDGLPADVTLKRVAADGGAVREMTRLPSAYFFNIAASPDGRSVAFAARGRGRDDIWTVALSGGPPKQLTANTDATVYYSRLAWLRDGSAIVFGKQVRFTLLSRVIDIK